ncbi:hypothetical protein PshuTeo1_38190 [Pseudomonas hunanensis]|nr:hypothetical protein PshuTeo1_38190 [Pseudomonas hunanensis]
MKRVEPLHIILVAGFSAVVITLIGCTYVIDKALMKIYGDRGNDFIVQAIEEEGAKLRELIGEKQRPTSTQQGSGLYWFDQ